MARYPGKFERHPRRLIESRTQLTCSIQTGAVDDVYRTISQTDDAEKQAEGKKIVEQLGALKYEVEHDRPLTPIVDDGYSAEVAAYNKEIEQLGNPSWHAVPWLFSECYMYRRISTFFTMTKAKQCGTYKAKCLTGLDGKTL